MPSESQKLVLLEDVARIVVSSHRLEETLDHITSLLATRMGVEVCSLYLLEGGRLVLRSSRGLAPSAVGRVSMDPQEGLTGRVCIHSHLVDAVLNGLQQTPVQLFLVNVMLILSDADQLRIDFYKLCERILQAARKADGAPRRDGKLREFLAGHA